MKIGMRTIKTSIAVTLSISLGYILGLNSPFFAGVAAIIAMQGNLVDSYKMGKNRILGTVLGATVGLLGSLIFVGNPLLIGIGIIIIIQICNKLGWSKSISIATIVFISIMMNVEGEKIYYSLNRVLDTMVGIVVAVVVNFIISPPLTKNKIYAASENIIKEFSQALKTIILNEDCALNDSCLKEIEDKLEAINNEYPILLEEQNIHLYRKDTNAIDLELSRGLIKKLYSNLNIMTQMGTGFKIHKDNADILNSLYGLNLVGDDITDNLDIVYNYHLGASLDCLEKLKAMFGIL